SRTCNQGIVSRLEKLAESPAADSFFRSTCASRVQFPLIKRRTHPMNELDLFEAAIALTDPVQRAALLDRECAGRPELRARLEELLAAHGQVNILLDQNFARGIAIDSPGDAVTADAVTRAETVGTIIAGRYKPLEAI